ncbi:hypothetical protein [Piscinibacter terrae]|uniref:Uncharacterized protein n=1 Tax=Piscinibacter terrae TaxID=2496871 RepID=A0A3N7HT97_9BURK|nr:hypothetical protein [Albitalea terrae]RQP25537.1 hypothetical protein DZC73_00165 [Albitalea terrae]
MADASSELERMLELWKAIHGGCWPGPPPDRKLNALVNEVVSGFALLNMAHAFNDAAVAKQVQSIAVESLNKSLPAVQHAIAR